MDADEQLSDPSVRSAFRQWSCHWRATFRDAELLVDLKGLDLLGRELRLPWGVERDSFPLASGQAQIISPSGPSIQ